MDAADRTAPLGFARTIGERGFGFSWPGATDGSAMLGDANPTRERGVLLVFKGHFHV